MYVWLIHFAVQHKLTQQRKALLYTPLKKKMSYGYAMEYFLFSHC